MPQAVCGRWWPKPESLGGCAGELSESSVSPGARRGKPRQRERQAALRNHGPLGEVFTQGHEFIIAAQEVLS